MPSLTTLWIRARSRWHAARQSDRGSTTENVIWIAFLAGTALTIVRLFGPQILDAAQSVSFHIG